MRYFDYFKNAYYLAFSEQFMKDKLPKQWDRENKEKEQLVIELVVRKNPVTVYSCNYSAFYEFKESVVRDENYNLMDAWCLKPYMYSEHYCDCNRWQDAIESGYVPKEEDYEENEPRDQCGEIIFDINKIYCKDMPELILYTETISLDELESLYEKFKF